MARVLLGVTGCIAAYKAAVLLRELQKKGHDVQVVMTRHATEFVGPITFEALSGRKVWLEMFGHPTEGGIEHIELARNSDLFVVAPATANTLAKFASGVADDFLSTVHLSLTCPVIVAPAMNVEMWRHPATQENLSKLQARGVRVVYPESGYLACGVIGEGRLAEVESVIREVQSVLNRSMTLAGKKVLVTAGPTCEDIDPVRFLSNRSSGKMGYALARAAALRGGSVILISGPTQLQPPAGAERVLVRTARQMEQEVQRNFPDSDVLFMAAAVGDYTADTSTQKIKRHGELTLKLKETPDILAGLNPRQEQIVVGFALETDDLEANAITKMRNKRLNLIVANDPETMGSDSNRVVLLRPDGTRSEFGPMRKSDLAERILDEAEGLLKTRRSAVLQQA